MSDQRWRIPAAPATIEAVLAAAVLGRPVTVDGGRGLHVEIRGEAGGERVPVARLAWEGDHHRVVALACFRAAHGVAPAYRALAGRLRALAGSPDPGKCPTCRGTGWLPVDSPMARQSALIALSLGSYRGVVLPRSERILESVAALGGDLATLVE